MENQNNLKGEVRKQTLGYILGALGLVAGLAWNDAIKATIDELLPLGKSTLLAQFIYAIVVTIVVVILATNLKRYFDRE